MKTVRGLYAALAAVMILSSCVSKKKFREEQLKRFECDNLADSLRDVVLAKDLKITDLEADTTRLASLIKEQKEKIAKLNESVDTLSQKKAAVDTRYKQTSRGLEQARAELRRKEAELESRERRVAELEQALSNKDRQLRDLKNSIKQSLISFSAEELTVEEKDGKLYVSLSNKLLFAPASTAIDAKGKSAIQKLAAVLKKTKEVDIQVEGHTDNVPVGPNLPYSDNWELSYKRALAVTQLLMKGGVSVKRIIPAGRGETMPKETNKTAEGRAANRRTEIILEPRLDDILKKLK